MYSQLTGGQRQAGFAQLFSRVAKRVRLSRAKDADVLALLDAWRIDDAEARQLCLGIGRRPGALRGLSQTLRLASMFAATSGAARPTAEHVRDACKTWGRIAALPPGPSRSSTARCTRICSTARPPIVRVSGPPSSPPPNPGKCGGGSMMHASANGARET